MLRKEKRRTVEAYPPDLPVYNSGERCGPPSRIYNEVSNEEELKNAQKKNLLWLLTRLHSTQSQKVSGWTGFNISVRQRTAIIPDNVGYLPTTNAPATHMPTVNEITFQSLKIKEALSLKSIVVVFDQALYAKATEILWKHPERCKGIIPRLKVFHTIFTFLSIIGKRFKDAGFRNLHIAAGVLEEGSVARVLDGHKYNRAVGCHKLVYEASSRIVWKNFTKWLEDHDQQIRNIPTEALEDVKNLCAEICD